MKLNYDNVILTKLTHEYLELVRSWRNDFSISKYMLFQEYITEEMQLEWFSKINNNENFYFIIEIDNNKIGLADIKRINYSTMHAEVGIFIYDEKYLNGIYSYKIMLKLVDFAFDQLSIKQLNMQMLSTNIRVLKFAQSLGCKRNVSLGEDWYSVDKITYKECKKKLQRMKE